MKSPVLVSPKFCRPFSKVFLQSGILLSLSASSALAAAQGGKPLLGAAVPVKTAATSGPAEASDDEHALQLCDELAEHPEDSRKRTLGVKSIVSTNIKDAMAACSRATDLRPADGKYLYQKGRALRAHGDIDAAVNQFRRAAELGHPYAQHVIGTAYFNGSFGLWPDRELGMKWLSKAHVNGEPMASNMLAVIYKGGHGVVVSYEKAISYYEAAASGGAEKASAGSAKALTSLGVMHEKGQGFPKNATKAMEYYRAAAELGDSMAEYYIAINTQIGLGTDKDIDAAIQWYERAAVNGNPKAAYSLGNLYLRGKEFSPKPDLAMKWLLVAQKLGHKDAAKLVAKLEREMQRKREATASRHSLSSDGRLYLRPAATICSLPEQVVKAENGQMDFYDCAYIERRGVEIKIVDRKTIDQYELAKYKFLANGNQGWTLLGDVTDDINSKSRSPLDLTGQ